MEVALLIASLSLLAGMLGQLALLPRRRRATARRITAATPSAGGTTHGRLAVVGRAPTVD